MKNDEWFSFTRTLLVHLYSYTKNDSLVAYAAREFLFCHLSYFADFVHQPGGIAAGVDLLGDVRDLVTDHVLDGVFVHLVLLGQGVLLPIKFAPSDQIQPVQGASPVQAHISHAVHGNNALLVDGCQPVSVRVKRIDRGQAIDLQLRG